MRINPEVCAEKLERGTMQGREGNSKITRMDRGRRQMALTSDGSAENGNEGTDVKEKLGNRTMPGYIKHLLAQVFSAFKSKPQSGRDFYPVHHCLQPASLCMGHGCSQMLFSAIKSSNCSQRATR